MENSKVKNYILKIGFMISTILLVLPSILYFFRNGNTTFVDKKFEFKFLMVDGIDGKTHMIVYLAVVIVMILLYALIIKKVTISETTIMSGSILVFFDYHGRKINHVFS